jgi:hypothetical protein
MTMCTEKTVYSDEKISKWLEYSIENHLTHIGLKNEEISLFRDYVKALYTECSLKASFNKYLAMITATAHYVELHQERSTIKTMIETITLLYPKLVIMFYNISQATLLAAQLKSLVYANNYLEEFMTQFDNLSLLEKLDESYDHETAKSTIKDLTVFCQKHAPTQNVAVVYEGPIDITSNNNLADQLYMLAQDCEERIKKNSYFQKMSITKLQIRASLLFKFYNFLDKAK